MGGAAGHLNHVFEDRDLKFGEFKKIVADLVTGDMIVNEKVDGLNLVFSYNVNTREARAARNIGNIRSGGLSASELHAKFENRGELTNAFVSAFTALSSALSSMALEDLVSAFGNDANWWYSMEIVTPETANVIKYDGKHIVFHKSPIIHVKDDVVEYSDNSDGVRMLFSLSGTMHGDWELHSPLEMKVPKLDDSVGLKIMGALNDFVAQHGMSDENTIGDYLGHKFKSLVASTVSGPAEITDSIAEKALDGKLISVAKLQKSLSADSSAAAREILENSNNLVKEFLKPLEQITMQLANHILPKMKSSLLRDGDKEAKRLRAELINTIQRLQSSQDQKVKTFLDAEISRLGNPEEYDASLEGITFNYNNKSYKITGKFAPLNQIIGYDKFGRAAEVTESFSTTQLRKIQESILRKQIRNIYEKLVRHDPGFDAAENAAKENYEAAVASLLAWDENVKKKDAFQKALEKLRASGMSEDKARQTLKGNPRYTYDVALSQKKRKTLEDALADAQAKYSQYEPSILMYAGGSRRVRSSAPPSEETLKSNPPSAKTSQKIKKLNFDKLPRNTLIPWPEDIKKSGIPFGSSTAEDSTVERGIGPGEEWLSVILDAVQQGQNVSYDLRMRHDGSRWEVKFLEKKSTLVRLGAEGYKVSKHLTDTVDKIMKELKEFTEQYARLGCEKTASDATNAKVDFLSRFIEANYESFVVKGEITRDKFIELRSAMKVMNSVIADAPKKTANYKIRLDNKVHEVDVYTFIRVANALNSEQSKSTVGKIDPIHIALSKLTLNHYNDPATFINELLKSVTIDEAFENVEGVIVTNPHGFTIVPRQNLSQAFRFENVSGRRARFRFMG